MDKRYVNVYKTLGMTLNWTSSQLCENGNIKEKLSVETPEIPINDGTCKLKESQSGYQGTGGENESNSSFICPVS